MSHQDYIAKCDEDQLESLIDLAQARLTMIRESGYVPLWVVSDSWLNHAWFADNEHRKALDKMVELAGKSPEGENCSWMVRRQRFRPSEAASLLAAPPVD